MTSQTPDLESSSNFDMQVNPSPDRTHEKPDVTGSSATHRDEEPEYATGLRLFLTMFTIFMSTLLCALEIGIIATAIPAITDEFHRLDDAGWYGSATFLVSGAAAPMWGKFFNYLKIKYAYIASVVLYLLGSIVAAAAPNSESVIVGRALQGFGGAGTLSGSVLIIHLVAHPKRHPVLLGSWMGVFMGSTILGPIIGGALTSGVSWRWCFWINLPLGGPIVVLSFLFLNMPKQIKPVAAAWKDIIYQLDLPGFAVLLASLVCMTLALQWGGQGKMWSNGSVIATLVVWIVLNLGFFAVEGLQGARAMVPLKLLQPRMTWANALYCFISNAALFQVIFYLPIYFQSIHNRSAIMSGVDTIPFLAFFALGSMTSGAVIGKTRHLQPYQLASALLMTAGMALFYTMNIHSSSARYFGAEILFGFGIGLGNQIPMTAVQGFSKPQDVANSTGIMLMCQAISGAYFVAVAQSIFANRMLHALKSTAPGLDPLAVLGTGYSNLRRVFEGSDLAAVLDAYWIGIKDVFAFSLACSAFAVLLACLIPMRRLPDHGENKKQTEATDH